MGMIHKEHQWGGGPFLWQAVRSARTKSLQSWLFETPWTVTHQALLSMGFSRQEYWMGLPFPTPGDLPKPGIKPGSLMSPALAGGFFTTSPTWEAQTVRRGLSISWFDGLYENAIIKWWTKFCQRSHLRHHCETWNVTEFRLDLLGNRQLLENIRQERRHSECLL